MANDRRPQQRADRGAAPRTRTGTLMTEPYTAVVLDRVTLVEAGP